MAKSRLKPSLEDTFAVGTIIGTQETLQEILELVSSGGFSSLKVLEVYLKARLKQISAQKLNNPFNKTGSK